MTSCAFPSSSPATDCQIRFLFESETQELECFLSSGLREVARRRDHHRSTAAVPKAIRDGNPNAGRTHSAHAVSIASTAIRKSEALHALNLRPKGTISCRCSAIASQ